jgi:hypothetical protein
MPSRLGDSGREFTGEHEVVRRMAFGRRGSLRMVLQVPTSLLANGPPNSPALRRHVEAMHDARGLERIEHLLCAVGSDHAPEGVDREALTEHAAEDGCTPVVGRETLEDHLDGRARHVRRDVVDAEFDPQRDTGSRATAPLSGEESCLIRREWIEGDLHGRMDSQRLAGDREERQLLGPSQPRLERALQLEADVVRVIEDDQRVAARGHRIGDTVHGVVHRPGIADGDAKRVGDCYDDVGDVLRFLEIGEPHPAGKHGIGLLKAELPREPRLPGARLADQRHQVVARREGVDERPELERAPDEARSIGVEVREDGGPLHEADARSVHRLEVAWVRRVRLELLAQTEDRLFEDAPRHVVHFLEPRPAHRLVRVRDEVLDHLHLDVVEGDTHRGAVHLLSCQVDDAVREPEHPIRLHHHAELCFDPEQQLASFDGPHNRVVRHARTMPGSFGSLDEDDARHPVPVRLGEDREHVPPFATLDDHALSGVDPPRGGRARQRRDLVPGGAKGADEGIPQIRRGKHEQDARGHGDRVYPRRSSPGDRPENSRYSSWVLARVSASRASSGSSRNWSAMW